MFILFILFYLYRKLIDSLKIKIMKTDKITMRVQRFGNVIITQFIQNKKIIETITEYK